MTTILVKPQKKVNYLNNRDILKQIHLSKTSYCSFTNKDYHRYDLIVDMPEESIEKSLEFAFQPEQIEKAKEARAARLSYELGEKVSVDTISTTDLVFRVMTWDHIPVSAKEPRKIVKKKTAKDIIEFFDEEDTFEDLEDISTKDDVDDMVHVKVNFPPFQHFKLDDNNSFHCVGKSHWKGDLETGEFSKTHGRTTDTLARMYIMLCEKYAMKFNWRGYTYNDEMRGAAILQLAYVGLRFNEAKSQNPFAYYTAAITNSFCRVLNAEKRVQNIRDDILEAHNLNPSWTRQNENSDRDYNG
jgi:hypothetical protein